VLTDLRHLLRLFATGRSFARQDALFLLQESALTPRGAKLALKIRLRSPPSRPAARRTAGGSAG
jgi:hypothetical protein